MRFSTICKKKNFRLAKAFIDKMNDPNDFITTDKKDEGYFEYGRTPLIVACFHGFDELVDYLVTLNVDLNKPSKCGMNPALTALRPRNNEVDLNIFFKLKKLGADLSKTNSYNENIFHVIIPNLRIAFRNGNQQQVDILTMLFDEMLALGLDINQVGNRGVSVLTTNIYNDWSICQYLINKGAKVIYNSNSYDSGYTPLIVCCRGTRDSAYFAVRYLLEEGCDVNYQDDYGNTALHYATDGVSPEISILLTKNGADWTIQNNESKTPRDNVSEYVKSIKLYGIRIEDDPYIEGFLEAIRIFEKEH